VEAVGATVCPGDGSSRRQLGSTGTPAPRFGLLVDLEVIKAVAALAGWSQRHRFHDRCHLALFEVLPQLAQAVGGVAADLGAGWLVEQARCRLAVPLLAV
jgi:hypothetical protein